MAKRSDSPLHGILPVDKPAGWSSHDVVAKVRRLSGQRRIGHTGTLDPAATGLLVLCLGQATRLVEYVTAHDKRYTGEITLGVRTATDDAEGDVVERRPVPELGPERIEQLARQFTGPLQQRPPSFSAVSVGGKRAYAVARRGGELELPARAVVVHHLQLQERAPGVLAIDVHCGPGTYIRSIARDIGEALGCGAHLTALRRTHAGPFDPGGAYTLGEIETAAAAGQVGDLLLPADEGIAEMEAAILAPPGVAELRFGRGYQAASAGPAGDSVARIYSADGGFHGVASVSSSGLIRPLKVLNLPN